MAVALQVSKVHFVWCGSNGVLNQGELARLLAELVSPTRPQRDEVMQMRDAIFTTINGGRSSMDLDIFVECLSELSK